jgi:hypothetical protein
MIDEHEDFDGTRPFAPHFFDGSGFRILLRFSRATERAR